METLDEFQSITTGYGRSSSMKYQTYHDLLINPFPDMTEQRSQIQQNEVTSTKHPPILTMMDLTMNHPTKLQVEVHNIKPTWKVNLLLYNSMPI